jgi:predicted HAD superfamily Cof-like phosphohydrolase
MNYLEMVEEFHMTFDQIILAAPSIPKEGRIKLRLGLIREETNELEAAYTDGNVIEMADALADIVYVVLGTVLESGLKLDFNRLFAEVHRSNMSKACHSLDEAERTAKHHNIPCDIRTKTIAGKQVWLVFRVSDNKLMKSINYSPANIASCLQAHE